MAPCTPTDVEDLSAQGTDTFVNGEVVEMLEGFGLAHVRTCQGQIYGLNRDTPGIEFSQLREGVRVRCKVTAKFHRVVPAQLIG